MKAVMTPMGISWGETMVRASKVANHHERRPEQDAHGQHPTVIGADHQPDDVGNDQPDETDHPADRHRHAHHQRGDDEQVPAQPGHVDAQRGGRLGPHGQRVQ